MDDDLGVRVGFEAMSARLQGAAQLEVVIDLAVEYHPYRAIFVVNRLMAAAQIDDAQAPHRQTDTRLAKRAAVVRTSPHERAVHAVQRVIGDGGVVPEVSAYSTHILLL